MKKIISLCLLSLLVFPALGQGRTEKVRSVSIYLLGADYGVETPIGSNWTLRPHAGIDGGLGWSSNAWTSDNFWYYAVRAAAGVDFRYYYNLSRRQERGRSTRFNSGNFFGMDAQYFTPSFVEHNVSTGGFVLFSPRWGFRRVYRQKWIFEFDLGLNIATNGNAWDTAPRLGLKGGFVF